MTNITITTTYTSRKVSGAGIIVAKGAGKQATTPYDDSKSANYNHGVAAAALARKVIPSGGLDAAAARATHEHVAPGKQRFIL